VDLRYFNPNSLLTSKHQTRKACSQATVRVHSGQTQKKRHFRYFRALKFESVQTFTSAKFVWKRYIKCPDKYNFAPIKLADLRYFKVKLSTLVCIFLCKIMAGTAHACCVWPLWTLDNPSNCSQRSNAGRVRSSRHNFTKENTDKCRKFHFNRKS